MRGERYFPRVRARVTVPRSAPLDRQLHVQLEVLLSVFEWESDPGLEARLVRGYEATGWQPGLVDPVHPSCLAQLQIDDLADFELRDDIELQGLFQVLENDIDGSIDPLHVVERTVPRGFWSIRKICQAVSERFGYQARAMKTLYTLVVLLALSACQATDEAAPSPSPEPDKHQTMELGAFSISLAVKDLAASQVFYEILGFEEAGGDAAQNWLILRNGDHTIGLFQGMFEKNIMTFNPGWTKTAEPLDEFTDVRVIQRHLKEAGLKLETEADESTSGPASVVLLDPDGNMILIDQHVD